MTNWISGWVQGIIIAVIIGTIIEMILPEGNCKKYIKVVIGIYILFSIISPIISKFSGKEITITDILDLEKYVETVNSGQDGIYNTLNNDNSNNIKEIYINSLKNDIKNKLKDKEYEVTNINVQVSDDEEYKLQKLQISINKIEQEEEDNNIESVNKIEINISNEIENTEAEKHIELSNSEKNKLKEYLSIVYEISEKNIEIL